MESTIQAINHIVKTPGNFGGKPHIAGRRIAVHDIVISHLQLGAPISEVASSYNLSLAEVYAALAYYYDHREEIDAAIRELDEITAKYGPGEEMLAEQRKRLEDEE